MTNSDGVVVINDLEPTVSYRAFALDRKTSCAAAFGPFVPAKQPALQIRLTRPRELRFQVRFENGPLPVRVFAWLEFTVGRGPRTCAQPDADGWVTFKGVVPEIYNLRISAKCPPEMRPLRPGFPSLPATKVIPAREAGSTVLISSAD